MAADDLVTEGQVSALLAAIADHTSGLDAEIAGKLPTTTTSWQVYATAAGVQTLIGYSGNAATPWALIQRDGGGAAYVGTPTLGNHAATRSFVEAAVAAIGADEYALPAPDWLLGPIPGATTTPTQAGTAVTAVGTATASGALTTATSMGRTPHLKYRVTTAAATAIASVRQNTAAIGPISSSGRGGFRCRLTGGPDSGTSLTTDRFFMGLRAATGAPTDVDPSTLTDVVGVGWDAADSTVQIIHNDSAGAATKINTGWALPTSESAQMYRLELFSDPTLGTVKYRLTNLGNSLTFVGEITTDLPASTLFLSLQLWHSVGGTSSVVGVALGPCRGQFQLG